MPLSRHSVGIYQETSSHATRQGTLAYSHLTVDGISVREPKKKKKSAGKKWIVEHSPKILADEEKANTTMTA